MPDKTEKKAEAKKPTPQPQADPHAAHLAALKKFGSRICPDCSGIGLVRTTEGQPRTECKTCLGTGSVPCPAGELEVFISNEAQIDPTAGDLTMEVIEAGWQRFPAARQVRPDQPTRCYHYRVPGSELPLAVVTEAEIDQAAKDGADGLAALVAAKLGN